MSLPENANVMAPIQGTVCFVTPSEAHLVKLEAIPVKQTGMTDHASVEEALKGNLVFMSEIAEDSDSIKQTWMVLQHVGGFLQLQSAAPGAAPTVVKMAAKMPITAADLTDVLAGTKFLKGTVGVDGKITFTVVAS